MAQALDGQGICILHQTKDHRIDLAEHVPSVWAASSLLNKNEAEFMAEPTARLFATAVDKCLEHNELQTIEFELSNAGVSSLYHARLVPDEDGVLTILNDITEQRNRETTMASLLREVSHRSKNLLAIVQSVAMQTAHHTGDIQDFLQKFRGRLHALSSTQDLVTESNWRGTHLQQLVGSQLARAGHAANRKVQVTGDNPVLGPNASLHIGLAIHELAANALAHGGLANGKNGNVAISAAMNYTDGAAPNLIIEWTESSPGMAQSTGEPRFGTLVLERIVPLSVSGAALFSIKDEQVFYRLTIPAGHFEA